MPHLSAVERERALGMLTGGMSQRDVARRLHCHHTTISHLQQRFQLTGVSVDRPRPGQLRLTTPRQDAFIRLQHLRDRFRPAAQTARQTMGRHWKHFRRHCQAPTASGRPSGKTAFCWPCFDPTAPTTTASVGAAAPAMDQASVEICLVLGRKQV